MREWWGKHIIWSMFDKQDVLKIIDEEIKEIKSMKPEPWENEVTFEARKKYYLAEAKAIRLKLRSALE